MHEAQASSSKTPSLLERCTDAGNDDVGAVSDSGREASPCGISSVIEQLVLCPWHQGACRYRSSIVEFMTDMHPSRCRAIAADLAACQPQGVGCMYFKIALARFFYCEKNSCYVSVSGFYLHLAISAARSGGSLLSSFKARMGIIIRMVPSYPAYPCDAS
jgi:hypothetical protein